MRYFLSFFGVAMLGFAAPQSCDSLAKLALPQTTVTAAVLVPAGGFMPAPNAKGKGPDPIFKTLPAFCRVTATMKPTSESTIKIEVWMPEAGWNGRFEVIGNGGWSSNIGVGNLAQAVLEGYAAAGTDTGHDTNNSEFTFGHIERLIDFGYRAVHETTVKGKALITAHYGKSPEFSYWNACSTGGRQGLNAAQRYPQDFDGIIAGAPANPMTRLHAGSIWNTKAAHEEPGSYIPPSKYPAVHAAALAACDAADGLKDGLISNPPKCKFDPKVLLCANGDNDSCLTALQVASLTKAYSGARNPRTGAQIFPGWEPGFELGLRVTAGPEPEANAIDTFRAVLQKPDWDWRTLDFDKDIAMTDKLGNPTINAAEPAKLKSFLSHGKLLMFHGWADPNIAPRNSVNYYQSVVAALGERNTSNSIRLFMFPGMGHCGGGEGPNTWDKMKIISDWVEHNKAPETIVASHSTNGQVDRTRPSCPYPQMAQYKGSGSIDEAANFSCAVPK